ncbi:MAG: TIGR01777 family oxidoreductase [Pseudomonadota bacterium]
MQILITGGTGLIGRALCRVLRADGHQLTVLSRQPASVAAKCGPDVTAMASLAEWTPQRHFDAVINLAGEPIADHAWTQRRKQALHDSRIALTERLVACIAQAERKPELLISGSAIGYYGNGGSRELDEESRAGGDFAAKLCHDWEGAALGAASYGVRICLLRTGLVLSGEGGLLGRMLLPFRLGLGARLGDGRQWMSWIHIDDYVAQVRWMLRDAGMFGVFNMTAPHPVTNAEFTRTLAQTLHRPAIFFAPAFLLRLALGERASLLLEGQRVLPRQLQARHARFLYPELAFALRAILA